MENVNTNYLKLSKALVLTNCKSVLDDSEINFDYEFNGVNVAIDICKYDNSVCVYASDNVCYTFSKMYNDLNHAINGLNLWLKQASYKK